MEAKKVAKLNKNAAFKALFNTIDESDVLKQLSNGDFAVGGKILPQSHKDALLADAKLLKTMPLWDHLLKDMKYESNKKMYENAQSVDDIIFGKACLWLLDVMEKKIDKLSKMK